MRVIDADELLKKLNEEGIPYNADVNYLIQTAPTVKVVKLAEWYEKEVFSQTTLHGEMQSARCSCCGLYHTTPYMYCFKDYRYCPNCGAKMDGGDD